MPTSNKPPTQARTHRVACKQWLLIDHFSKNAANGPQVHRRGVVLNAQQDLCKKKG